MNKNAGLREATVAITVPFHDVDSIGAAWHGHYAKYFEIARC
jgi:acyl-CoA thioester hydrolase